MEASYEESKSAASGISDVPSLVSSNELESTVSKVIVFTDRRAEVTRNVTFQSRSTGFYDVEVQNIPQWADSDSVRVEGTGDCTILNVTFEKLMKENQVDTQDLQNRLDGLKLKLGQLDQAAQRSEYISSAVKLFTEEAAKSESSRKDGKASQSIQAMSEVLEFAEKTMQTKHDQQNQINQEKEACEKELRDVEYKIQSSGKTGETSNQVTVNLQAHSAGKITLKVRYMVSRASWKPSYDCRVTDSGLLLTYYGVITQSTGEDWEGASIHLSTAVPSAQGGAPPKLPPKVVSIMPKYRAPQHRVFAAKKKCKTAALRGSFMESEEVFKAEQLERDDSASYSSQSAEIAMATVDGDSGGFGRSTFQIKQVTSVKSDNKPKKVTIAVINSEPSFLHLAVPSLEDAAYLQASTTNGSPFPLLPSDDVSVFFHNSFIAKTKMETVVPEESFRLFLGSDPEVSISYAPVKSLQTTKGFIGSKKRAKHFGFQTTIKNNKSKAIVCVITEPLPCSQDDSVKVTLKEPSIEALQTVEQTQDFDAAAVHLESHPSNLESTEAAVVHVLQNSITNNLIWILAIPSRGQIVVPFSYTVEWPKGSDIEIKERPNLDADFLY